VKLVIPMKVASVANLREHWRSKARRNAVQRAAVHLAVTSAWARGERIADPPPPGTVVTFTRVAPRELDDDNLASAFKAIRDQVAAEMGIDDRDKRVRWAYAQRKGGPRECAVVIEITTPEAA
jgi:hypothetical protein